MWFFGQRGASYIAALELADYQIHATQLHNLLLISSFLQRIVCLSPQASFLCSFIMSFHHCKTDEPWSLGPPHLLDFLRTLTWVCFFFFGRKKKSNHVPVKLLILSPSDQQIRLPHIQLLILAPSDQQNSSPMSSFWFFPIPSACFAGLEVYNCDRSLGQVGRL